MKRAMLAPRTGNVELHDRYRPDRPVHKQEGRMDTKEVQITANELLTRRKAYGVNCIVDHAHEGGIVKYVMR